jgi:hypothetical protein
MNEHGIIIKLLICILIRLVRMHGTEYTPIEAKALNSSSAFLEIVKKYEKDK